MVNHLPEIEVIIQAVDELPSSGEKKERSNAIMCLPSYEIYNNCTLIRLPSGFVVHGISKLSIKLCNSSLQTFECGSELNHSIEIWRTFIRQAFLKGFLNRLLVVGSDHNMITDIVFATYTVADAGTELLKNVEFQEV